MRNYGNSRECNASSSVSTTPLVDLLHYIANNAAVQGWTQARVFDKSWWMNYKNVDTLCTVWQARCRSILYTSLPSLVLSYLQVAMCVPALTWSIMVRCMYRWRRYIEMWYVSLLVLNLLVEALPLIRVASQHCLLVFRLSRSFPFLSIKPTCRIGSSSSSGGGVGGGFA